MDRHIAVGSREFSETIKNRRSIEAKGRIILEVGDGFQGREEQPSYFAVTDHKKGFIGTMIIYAKVFL
ncbi:MAG: hypothetical protein GY757_57120 [bacterium]|nr:hypothetical protein [bacterium]